MWILLACIGIILLFCKFIVSSLNYWKIRGVPTASGRHWLYGHYKPILFQEKHVKTVANEMYNEFPGAPAVGYFKLHTPGLLVRDSELAKTILITEFSNFATNGFFIDRKYDFLAGSNPFFVRDAEWRTVRSHATAATTIAKLKWYLPRMMAVGDKMAKYVEKNCDGGAAALDVKDLGTKFTADILGNAICGVVNNSFEDPDSLFARITREVCFATTVKDNVKDALQTAWPRLSYLFQMRFSSPTSEEQLLYLTRKMIEERSATGDKRNDLYQVAISMRENDPEEVFTDQYISSLVYTIMLDQYETGSNAVVNTLFALAWNPEVQDRLRKEIIDFKSKVKGEYTIDIIDNLKYLEMVLSETLRMCCPVPVLSRECTNDCTITVPSLGKSLKISKGTQIIVPNQTIHMDPTYYPNPEKFDPERFTEEEIAKRPKYTYLPFGEGPKRCLAPRLGSLQVKVAIISLLARFKIRPAGARFPLACEPGVFLISSPVSGADLHFEPIETEGN